MSPEVAWQLQQRNLSDNCGAAGEGLCALCGSHKPQFTNLPRAPFSRWLLLLWSPIFEAQVHGTCVVTLLTRKGSIDNDIDYTPLLPALIPPDVSVIATGEKQKWRIN